ncbi:MAG: TIGR02679 family protein [Aquihabitans sp.]
MTTDGRVTEARRQLAEPVYASLWHAARLRLERTGLSITNRPVRVDVPPGPARIAITGLIGASPAGTGPLSVRLDKLDDLLRHSAAGCSLIDLLAEIGGPLTDRRAKREAAADATERTWATLATHSAVERLPVLSDWLLDLRGSGLALRLAGEPTQIEALVGQALDVLAALPVVNVPLARLAGQVAADTHALDRGKPLSTIVLSSLHHVPNGPSSHDRVDPTGQPTTSGAAQWRQAWARVGVLCDDLSVSVLVLNLPLIDGDAVIGTTIDRHRTVGEPLRLTLRQLTNARLRFPNNGVVRSCENPTVLAQAALDLGPSSAPLVCTDGHPDSAVHELFHQIQTAGMTLSHHGDFDWGGIRIANTVMERHGAEPWRYGSDDYLTAVESVKADVLGPPPTGLTACWDPELVEAMTTVGARIYEEQLLDDLLQDLRA